MHEAAVVAAFEFGNSASAGGSGLENPKDTLHDQPTMGFLDRFRRSPAPVDAPRAATTTFATHYDIFSGTETLEVVGESYRQDALWSIAGSRRGEPVAAHPITALLWPEPYEGERGDPNAVQVAVQGHLVGYLSRHDASIYRPGIVALMATCRTGRVGLQGEICGGGLRDDGPGMLGVFLSHDPALFGVSARRASDVAGFHTGLSEAMATDLEDDSYDLSWLTELPASDGAAIKMLRRLLEDERDPIDRHYMHCELETRLYKARDAFESALSEYDAACEAHDIDMAEIRPALFAKFDRVPVLDTYRQAAIRAQKARNWVAVHRWAQRGIDLYGGEAARPEALDDLHKRLAYATNKLASAESPGSRS